MWVPTIPLMAMVAIILVGIAVLALRTIHPFLAPTRPVDEPDLLVVEGWMPDYNLPRVIEEFRKGPYLRVAATGIALDQGHYLQEYQSYGEVVAATLREMGLEEKNLMVGAATDTRRHRTYNAAKALKRKVDESGLTVDALTVFSQATHSRRTWMIFQKVFGEEVEVGIVALPNESYDNNRWWGSSAGIKVVGMELIAFVSARVK